MSEQCNVQVVLESEVFGRELFLYEDDDQAFAALHRLLAESRSEFQKDGIKRVVGIIIGHDQR
jgi:hypothetical protein